MRSLFIVFIFLLTVTAIHAQSYDKMYVKNLKYRLLVSYISETRELNTTLQIDKKNDPEGKEKLLLKNSPNLLSGIMFQADNLAYYVASALPQTNAEIDKYGKQKSFITKASLLIDALLINVNYINQTGLYDQNYLNHPDSEGDSLLYRRHNNSNLQWTSVDMNYYAGQRKFCLGVPVYFGERQLKSKFFMGSRMAYNYMRLSNGNTSFFRDSASIDDSNLKFSSMNYQGASFALTPSAYLVAKKKWFLFLDASLGFSAGLASTNLKKMNNLQLQLELPQAKIACGINTDRFLMAVYYTYLNQSFKSGSLTVGTALNNFGFLFGFRINQLRYRHLRWD